MGVNWAEAKGKAWTTSFQSKTRFNYNANT